MPMIEDLDGSDPRDGDMDNENPNFSMKMRGPFNERN